MQGRETIEPCDEANPLRQVIVNTHSSAVFQQVPEDSVLVAELVEDIQKTSRRLRKFSSTQAFYRQAELIEDFSPLRQLSAFAALEKEVKDVVHSEGWKE